MNKYINELINSLMQEETDDYNISEGLFKKVKNAFKNSNKETFNKFNFDKLRSQLKAINPHADDDISISLRKETGIMFVRVPFKYNKNNNEVYFKVEDLLESYDELDIVKKYESNEMKADIFVVYFK